MKKMARLILEVNDLVFGWYVVMGGMLLGLDMLSNGALGRIGISRTIIYGMVGISACLKAAYALPRIKERPRILKGINIVNARRLFFFVATGACVIGGTIWYDKTLEVRGMLAESGMHPILAGALFMALFLMVAVCAAHEFGESRAEENEKRLEAEIDTMPSGNGFPIARHMREMETTGIARHIPQGAKACVWGGTDDIVTELSRQGIYATAYGIGKTDQGTDWVICLIRGNDAAILETTLDEIGGMPAARIMIIAPSCANPCSATMLGGDAFWKLSRWSPVAWFIGTCRIVLNLGADGIRNDEEGGYFRWYPWMLGRRAREAGFTVKKMEGVGLCLPYFAWLIPLAARIEQWGSGRIGRNLGYETLMILGKNEKGYHT